MLSWKYIITRLDNFWRASVSWAMSGFYSSVCMNARHADCRLIYCAVLIKSTGIVQVGLNVCDTMCAVYTDQLVFLLTCSPCRVGYESQRCSE